MQDCIHERGEIETNGDLVNELFAERENNRQCNADKKALRDWVKESR